MWKMIKQRKHIIFDDESHTYTNQYTGEKYISITKFISGFHKHFDGDKVALNLVLNNKKYQERFAGIETSEAVTILKDEWKKRSSIGTFIHEILERYLLKKHLFDESKGDRYNDRIKQLTGAFDRLKLREKYQVESFQTEMILFNDELKLAGQSDLVLMDHVNRQFSILDYKTNQKGISEYSFNDKRMFSPVEHLPDSNYWHYSLQLNLYAYLVEKEFGYQRKDLGLIWIDTNQPNWVEMEIIEVGNLENEIEKMLEVRKQSILELV